MNISSVNKFSTYLSQESTLKTNFLFLMLTLGLCYIIIRTNQDINYIKNVFRTERSYESFEIVCIRIAIVSG